MHHIHHNSDISGIPLSFYIQTKKDRLKWGGYILFYFICRPPPSDAEKMEIHGGYISPEDLE